MVYTVRREPFLSGRFGKPTRSVAVRSTDPVWEEGRRILNAYDDGSSHDRGRAKHTLTNVSSSSGV